MSTVGYAALSTRRGQGQKGMTTSREPPGIGTWIDAAAALVPAEVLGLHAIILSLATTKSDTGEYDHNR